mmetsp:Transcript_8031/g.12294  ORF Transcript_8031/g.12294 Transcript_8031/m.12294 type:complete len:219 (-) Transcript_8031:70-726(-)|eukprot:CAMPEP_0178907142 /NCGR_PEP_ID=MMETSP0786-20121207/7207_1 /TAXON_ID=186022 /ORGANISM="Thalassionema frauenfeldii, Strain CCMP 1798" /LENGTH=218 /DNA_ID=CAMNT_0020578909 /DNA_START=90 /DNA_END=746 /DNA_ORIENTATION=+
MNKWNSTILLVLCLVAAANGFFQNAGKAAKSSPLAQEAVDIYGAKFGYGRAPIKENAFDSISKLGVPKTDIDGTRLTKRTENAGKRITDSTEKQVAATFNGLAAVYGEERAIEMVKIFPICMSFDSKAFAATFAIWKDIYGEDETKDMVSRNPGLLAVQPKDAGLNTDNTMAFSYIIAATRPIGLLGPTFILALLMVPVIEGTTGIAIKEPLFAALGL